MRKFLLYICITIAGLAVSDRLVGLVICSMTGGFYAAPVERAKESQAQVAIIGASRASHHYDPQILDDSIHMTACNYGVEAMNIYGHYAMLSLLFDHGAIPHLVIVDLSESDVCDVTGWNTERLNYLYPYVEEHAVDAMLADIIEPCEMFFVRHSVLYRHNSRLVDYAKWLLLDFDLYASNGYTPMKGVWKGKPKEDLQQKYAISPQKLSYLERLIRLCEEHDVRLVLSISPNYKILPKHQRWVEAVGQMARKHGATFINNEQDNDFLAHPEWFNDPYHLNETGAEIFTIKFIRQLCLQKTN